MCFTRVAVIVIVISRDDSGEGLLKYINVGGKSTMVARLPQQVFLLLALVTGTTMGLGVHRRELPKSTRSTRATDDDETSGGRASDGMLRKTTIDPLAVATNAGYPLPPGDDDSSSVRTKSLGTNDRARWLETGAANTPMYETTVDESTSTSTSPGSSTTADGSQSATSAEKFAGQSRSPETWKTRASTVHGSQDDETSLPPRRSSGCLVLSGSGCRPSSSSSTTTTTTTATSMTSRPNSASLIPTNPPTSSYRASSRSTNSPVSLPGLYYTGADDVPTLASSGNTHRAHEPRTAKFHESFAGLARAELGKNGNAETHGGTTEPRSAGFTRDFRAVTSWKSATTEASTALAKVGERFSNGDETEEEKNEIGNIDGEKMDPKIIAVTRDFRAVTSRKLATTEASTTLAKLDVRFSNEDETEEEKNKIGKIDGEQVDPKLTGVTRDFRAVTSRKSVSMGTSSTLAKNDNNGKTHVERLEAKFTGVTRDFRAEASRKLVANKTSSQTRNYVKEANVTVAGATWRGHRGGQRETGRTVWLTGSRALEPATTLTPDPGLSYPRRYTRDASENNHCEKFEIGDPDKREFYSPNYPQNYPPLTDCVLVLEAEKGMLLKLDFREQFELEMKSPEGECRFDYLEVRDGQYGFSPRKGIYCDKEFPPEIHSQGRYLWLNFHSDDTIEYRGFKAVWSTFPRPNTAFPPEQEPCIYHEDIPADFELKNDMVKDAKKLAESSGVALDCLWVLQAPESMKMQLTFDTFKLEKPNDCSANFLDIFDGQTDEPSRIKKFCGSIAEAVSTRSSTLYIRLYLDLKAINSTFSALITSVRDKESNQECKPGEYDCQDATCIAESLKCNKRRNCRFQRDEDDPDCGVGLETQDRSRIVIILVIFSLIMFGMCSAFVFNCVRKLRRDHRIIREHIRQSREDRLDEIGRRATPCPLSVSRTDLRDGGSESPPGEEVDSSKELIPSAALTSRDYTKELALQMKYGNKDITDIHQSNNVSNATQERLQESSEEPDMCDSSCQTRESLFAPAIPDAILSSPGFSTFGYQNVVGPESTGGSHKGTPTSDQSHRHHHHHHQHPTPLRQSQRPSQESNRSNSQLPGHPDRCSHEGCAQICPKHNPIPAPPGWSLHDPPYPQIVPDSAVCPPPGENSTYRRYQSPKPEHETIGSSVYQHQHQQQPSQQQQYPYPHFTRQNTVGSGERYGSFIYGSGRASSAAPSSNATTSATSTMTTNPASNGTDNGSSPHSSATSAKHRDPRYRAEAVIEVDQKRPFSIESTKSAPDVIATH